MKLSVFKNVVTSIFQDTSRIFQLTGPLHWKFRQSFVDTGAMDS